MTAWRRVQAWWRGRRGGQHPRPKVMTAALPLHGPPDGVGGQGGVAGVAVTGVAAGGVTVCTACGAAFECRPGADCWCAKIPFQPMPDLAESCLCPDCLTARTAGGTPA